MLKRSDEHQQQYNNFVLASNSIVNCALTIITIYTVLLLFTNLHYLHLSWLRWLDNMQWITYFNYYLVILVNICLSFCFLMSINLFYQIKHKLSQKESYLITFELWLIVIGISFIMVIMYLLFINGIIPQIFIRMFSLRW